MAREHRRVVRDRELDAKGVVGEIEYEIGAALRNPREAPELFSDPATIDRRLRELTSQLTLNHARAVRWAFAQAVLSAIWDIEDGLAVDATHPSLLLAGAMRPMIERARP
jgi:streptomycin 6-kinase